MTKMISIVGSAVVAGAVRYSTEGPIPCRGDNEAQRLVDMKLAEFAEDEAEEEDDGSDDLASLKVEDLKALAVDEGADLGDATKKADIIAAIRAHRATAGQ